MPGTTIDLLGVIMESGPVSSIQTKSGDRRDKREVKLADESKAMINITLWGDVCHKNDFALGTLVALKSCRVSEFGGRSCNASSNEQDIILDVKH